MNLYLVQYAENGGMVQIWTESNNHLDAAANVLIDRGFKPMLHKQDNTMITVVCKDSSIAGNYPKGEVREYADRRLGLTTLPDNPPDEADWWKNS